MTDAEDVPLLKCRVCGLKSAHLFQRSQADLARRGCSALCAKCVNQRSRARQYRTPPGVRSPFRFNKGGL